MNIKDGKSKEWVEGWEYFCVNPRFIDDCPYEEGVKQWDDWTAGYEVAQENAETFEDCY